MSNSSGKSLAQFVISVLFSLLTAWIVSMIGLASFGVACAIFGMQFGIAIVVGIISPLITAAFEDD